MNCRNAAKLFSELIENTLDGELAKRLRAHLDRCPDCSELIEITELNIVQLENAAEPSLPDNLQQRLAAIPQQETAAMGFTIENDERSGGHWLFSNSAAAVILAMFFTVNLTWFNPDFQDSIIGCRELINDRSARVLQLASDWGEGLNELKQDVESRMGVVRDAADTAAKDAGEPGAAASGYLVTEIIRVLGLIAT
jgi:hypothetical protein